MAKILFIGDNPINESLGIMYLSSYLKANGHDVQLSLLSEYKGIDKLLRYIKNVNPDFVGFSVMTAQVHIFRRVTKIIKKNTRYRIIWGGPHCTFMPEEALENPDVDIICRGEGEQALLTLMNRIDNGEDYSDISNLWIKNRGQWIRNEIGYLESNLDKYPFPDRDLYYKKYPLLRNFSLKRVITQRGCPYNCAYCFEPAQRALYKGKGKWIRRHSIEYIIDEIKEIISKYPTRTIHFSDDTFNLNKDWLMGFLSQYKANINLPFTANVSFTNIDEEIIKKLKYSGCSGVVFGMETGCEDARMNILNKKIPNEKYVEVSKLLRKHKILFLINMMFCLPNESLDDAIESIHFCKWLMPYGVKAHILKIYKGTNLANYIIENNMSESEGEFTYKVKDINNEQNSIKNMIWAAYLFVKLPLLIHFAKGILKNSISKLLKPLVLLSHWQDIVFFKIPLWQAWKYFWHSRKIFYEGILSEQVDTYG